MAYDRDGTLRTHADGFWYCNGIAFDLDGNLVVVERAGLQRLNPDGTREWVIERLGRGAGDGFCLDRDGRYYVASTIEHGVRVIEDGKEVDFLEIEGEGVTTNCCFGGADGRLLFATDAVPGRVVVWEGLTTPGLPMHAWPGPPSPDPAVLVVDSRPEGGCVRQERVRASPRARRTPRSAARWCRGCPSGSNANAISTSWSTPASRYCDQVLGSRPAAGRARR